MRLVNLTQPDMENWDSPRTLLFYTTQAYNPSQLSIIRQKFPDLTIMGMSSFHGMFLPEGFKRGAFGVLFEASDNISMRAMIIDLTNVSPENVRRCVAHNLELWAAKKDLPSQFFIHTTQGPEERVIEGIHDAFSETVKVFGATAGHDKFLPRAHIFMNETSTHCGVLIIRLFSEHLKYFITCGGYMPTLYQGTVTQAHARIIDTIDNRPAAEVYDEWTQGMFHAYLERGGDLPRSAGLYPLARTLKTEPECSYWLSHPYRSDRLEKNLYLFSEIPTGSQICMMRGTEETLKTHMADTIANSLAQVNRSHVIGAFILYCAGCASIIAENMVEVCQTAAKAFGDIPFLGCCSFGEQGRTKHANQNYHGNMMTEIILVMKDV